MIQVVFAMKQLLLDINLCLQNNCITTKGCLKAQQQYESVLKAKRRNCPSTPQNRLYCTKYSKRQTLASTLQFAPSDCLLSSAIASACKCVMLTTPLYLLSFV